MKKILFLILTIFSFNIFANSYIPSLNDRGNVYLKEFNFEGENPSYFIFLPDSKKKRLKKENFYFIFHGESTKAEFFLNKTNLHSQIMRSKDAFVAFNSIANDWFSNNRKNLIEERFVLQVINVMLKNTDYNNYNIIAYSSGASLINKLICEGKINSKIKNIITINGSGKSEWLSACKEIKRKNIYNYLGTEDDYYGFDKKNQNKEYKIPSSDFLEMEKFYNELRIKLNCDSDAVINEIDNDTEDESSVLSYSYSCNIKSGNNFQNYIIKGMGHNLPNTIKLPLEDFRGNTNKDINILNIMN